MLINRIGDLSLLLGISMIFIIFGTLKYTIVFSLVSYFLNLNFNFLGFDFIVINLICFFLFIGAMGKSAQLGLHI
jgi:NADH-quinone oxidoreductase subunit L